MSAGTVWGVHMPAFHGRRPIEDGYIAIGWAEMGDLRSLPADRDAFKARLATVYPDKKKGAIPVDAGTLFRFVHEMQVGEKVIYPSKVDRMVNIGEIASAYSFSPLDGATESCHWRSVRWLRSFPRTNFSQDALHEIGSFITLFQVSTHVAEFLAALHGESLATDDIVEAQAEAAAAERIEESTEDFVIRRLKSAISPEEFEHFIAHLLTCMGYHARVTKFAGDAGIDIIAHRDELGFEPPVIKVQCKQVVSNIGRPEVQQLVGAVEQGEFGLFVALGGYSREALDTERSRANLRLIDGAMLTSMIFQHYENFDPRWQSVVPLRRRYIPDSTTNEA